MSGFYGNITITKALTWLPSQLRGHFNSLQGWRLRKRNVASVKSSVHVGHSVGQVCKTGQVVPINHNAFDTNVVICDTT